MSKIIIESPFANENQSKYINNYFYLCCVARKLMIETDASPLFFHTLYTQFLNDKDTDERNIGLYRSFEHHSGCDNKTYAIDRGISNGMILGAEDALKKGMEIKFYTILPEFHFIHKDIDAINQIPNILDRWNAGLVYVNYMKDAVCNKEYFEETGDLSGYEEYIKPLKSDVKDHVLHFFGPIIESI